MRMTDSVVLVRVAPSKRGLHAIALAAGEDDVRAVRAAQPWFLCGGHVGLVVLGVLGENATQIRFQGRHADDAPRARDGVENHAPEEVGREAGREEGALDAPKRVQRAGDLFHSGGCSPGSAGSCSAAPIR